MLAMPRAGTWSWCLGLQGMNPAVPGQFLQLEEAVTGHPQAGTCKAETLSHPSPLPLPLPKPALLWQTSLQPGSLGNFIRLTRNFAVGRDSRAPACGYKDVRSRVLFPIHFNGWLRISGELAIAPDYVNASLRGNSYGVNSRMRFRRLLMEPGAHSWRTVIKAGKMAKNPPLLPLRLQDKRIPCSPS